MKKKIEKDWVDAYFEHGIDIDNRRVWFVGDIDQETVITAIKGLYLMDTISDEPCEMFISSYGGDITEAHSLYDILGTVRCPVHTFAFGKCMSAAPLLLAAGEKGQRWVAPHAEFMAHDFSTNLDGKGADLRSDLEWTEKINEKRLRLLAKNSSKPYTFWKRLSTKKTDFYFSADDAVEWGLADHIWNERE